MLYLTALSEGVSAFFTIPHFAGISHALRCPSLQMANAGKDGGKQFSVEDPKNIRNVAFVGHSHSGKTTMAEWMLFDENIITKKPSSGESSLDSDPTEASRHSSIFSHFIRVPHRGHLLEVLDTPWGDFPSDAVATLDGADSAVVLVSAPDGLQAGAINAYQHCKEAGIKTLLALSKMDRPFLNINEILANIETSFKTKPVPLQVRVGEGEDFQGVKSLLLLDDDGNLKKNEGDDIEEAWLEMEEAVAMVDDELLVEYLENMELKPEQVIKGLRAGVRQGKILPFVYTSAEKDLGVAELMDAIITTLPDPMEMREEALKAACENEQGKCGMEPGVEAGFAARVIHTIVDSFGSLSVLRVISNNRDQDNGSFHSLPQEVVNLRTGDKIKMPTTANSFSLCGKDRISLQDGAHIVPGDVIAVPRLPENIHTNDILTVPDAVKEEEAEIFIEKAAQVLTPLSRPAEEVALMTTVTVSMPGEGSKKNKGKGAGGDEKLTSALAAMAREDLALRVEHDSASGKLLLRCMSGEHMQLVASRLKDRYDLDVEFGQPPVQYRETLVKKVTKVEGRHKKQSGGSGQFGVCYIDMEPLEEGAGIEFESQIKGGVISRPFISSVERGVREQLQLGGPLAGYPVTDVRITLVDGKMHSVDSKDIAFQSAGKLAVKAALERGGSRLLQPMDKVTFLIDENLQGEIHTIVSRHDGYITSTNPSEAGPGLEIEAIIPNAGMADLSDALRSACAGEGQFSSVFSHYQPVPNDLIEKIVENSPNHHS